ncbi:ABC transporter permease [Moorella naiadis]|uniref:ABC transporter permease n=1 Tax=Moorella naiadis (nom. illeg.) TaxID=3093670 RepID=UPI003D9C7D4F
MKIKVNKYLLHKLILLGILAIEIVGLTILCNDFFTTANLKNVIQQTALIVITGCGATLLMISGNIDLSVGSILALCGMLSALFVVWGMPITLSIVLSCIIGAFMGMLNGAMVVKLKITPVIATLGMMYVARGLSFIIGNGKSISVGLPQNFGYMGQGFIGPLPVSAVIVLIMVVIFYIIESKTVVGKYSFAIGGNKVAAWLSGINVDAIVFLLYTLVGLLAGLSGTLLASRLASGQPNVGVGFEFDVIVAVVLGGTPLEGGEGSVIGMLMGALLVGFLNNGMNLLGIQSFYQSVFKGIILVAAVLLNKVLKEKLT